jgi:hypothetical protein
VVLCPWAINRSPLFWGENGEEFVPERWIDTDKNGHYFPAMTVLRTDSRIVVGTVGYRRRTS